MPTDIEEEVFEELYEADDCHDVLTAAGAMVGEELRKSRRRDV